MVNTDERRQQLENARAAENLKKIQVGLTCCDFLVVVSWSWLIVSSLDDSTITPILVLMSAPDVGRLSSLTIDSCFPLFSSSSSSFLMVVVVVTVRACSLKAFLSSSTTAREKSKSESCGETKRRRRRMIHYFDL